MGSQSVGSEGNGGLLADGIVAIVGREGSCNCEAGWWLGLPMYECCSGCPFLPV